MNSDANGDPLEALREILIEPYRTRATELETGLAEVLTVIEALDERINDDAALIEAISPIMAQSIRATIRDSRTEMVEAIHPIMADAIQSSISESRDAMVEALYPILGRLVQRAVIEAMRDLTRTIDSQMRNAFSFQMLKHRLLARAGGVSEAEMAIREALPFAVDEIFLIHRESGLLLYYLELNLENVNDAEASTDIALPGAATSPDDASSNPISPTAATTPTTDKTDAATMIDADAPADAGELHDSDLISSMLTAIRDFAEDAFGRGEEGHLDEVQYGDKRILIEAAPHVYLAVVVSGIEPRGFRAEIREQVSEIENKFLRQLRDYDGDSTLFAAINEQLRALAASQTISVSAEKPLAQKIAVGRSQEVAKSLLSRLAPPLLLPANNQSNGANVQFTLLIIVALIIIVLLFSWGFIESLFI